MTFMHHFGRDMAHPQAFSARRGGKWTLQCYRAARGAIRTRLCKLNKEKEFI
jgi:hypothetical protein